MKYILFSCICIFSLSISAQKLRIVNEEKKDVSFRGLSAVDQSVFWVSGSNGTIGMTYNGGKNFKWFNPPGYESRDFRDIHVFKNKSIIVMAAGAPGIILKSDDGGRNWREVYRDDTSGVFFDSIDFLDSNPNKGILVGDPINGVPYILETTDAGETWSKVSSVRHYPNLNPDEAFFAASGSNIQMLNDSISIMATGGSHSNFIINSNPYSKTMLPKSGSNSAGSNGMEYSKFEKYGLIAGGDFTQPTESTHNLLIFEFNEKGLPVISYPAKAPIGYKSDVAILGNSKAVVCGVSGVSFSNDKGQHWERISNAGFHVCEKPVVGNKVFLAGPNGIIGVIDY
ncbi:MAG TPA: YCF48-related protein [Moheibacter sp.]|nr:YCF48-related protein [Moheibacter sp.]